MPDPLELYRNQRHAIGMITPSGNVVVERITAAILYDFPTVSAHYSRTPVFGSSDRYSSDYDWDGMLSAAELLGHANLDVICWNGSKGGSIGFDADRRLCGLIRDKTGAAATTSTLATAEVFAATGVTSFGLVTPYTDAYAGKIPPNFAREGFACVASAHAGISDNLAYCTVPEAQTMQMVRDVAAARPQAIITYCTNFCAAPMVAALEAELGIPVYDSVSIAVWKSLRLAGVPTAPGARWGSLFTDARLS
jgi:maleate isomerase